MINTYDYKNKKVRIINAGRKKQYETTLNKIGIVLNISPHGRQIGILLDGMINKSSSKGLFWFDKSDVELIMDEGINTEKGEKEMTGNYKVAMVAITGICSKDYGFALYEDANVGDKVIVNPRNEFALGTITAIMSKEEYTGSTVTKEVVSVIDTTSYVKRVAERENRAKLEAERQKIQRELDVRINKLRDIEFYERMISEFSYKDPELKSMLARYKEINKECAHE